MINRTPGLKLILACCFLAINSQKAIAQITPDNTLGAESSRVVPNGNIDRIDGGALRDRNLFHSFSEFNINNGQRVYFSNPSGIENILTRVTGRNASNILGTLGVNGAANLFLINPNGIVFGENARLDVNGSFVGSTADSIKFEDGNFFSAINSQETPLLTINVPIGLQIGTNPGKVIVQGNGHNLTYEFEQSTFATIRGDAPGLEAQVGKTLALVGGDIALEGGNLRAESGRIELGSVAQPGLVSLTENNSGFTLGYSGIENFGDIQLSQKASVDASGEGGGSIQVQSRRLSLKDGSSILSITSGAKTGRDFIVNATESVELIGESTDGNYASSLLTESQGAGTSGNLTVNTQKLTTTDGAYLSTYIVSSGDGGNLTVKATDSIELLGSGIFESGLYTATSLGSSGNAGELTVETGNLTVKNSATVFANSAGLGNGGDVLIEAFDRVAVSDARIVSIAGNGSSGDIRMTTGTLSLTNGSQLSTTMSGEGNAGNISVDARDSVKLDGIVDKAITSIRSDLLTGGVGKGGDIQIITGLLSVTNGALISAITNGQGDAGDITINAQDRVTVDGFDTGSLGTPSLISTTGGSDNVGNGGDIRITTGELLFKNGGNILSNNFGKGNSGNIFLDVVNTIIFDGVGSSTNSPSSANTTVSNGNAGNIDIKTGSLFLTNGGTMDAGGFPEENSNDIANAGSIIINARDRIELDGENNGLNTFLSRGVGKGGDIEITTGSLLLDNGSFLSTQTSGKGDAGNIKIDAADSISLSNSSLMVSNVGSGGEGKGGEIDINSKNLTLTGGSQITAGVLQESDNLPGGKGRGGEININASESITLSGIGAAGFASGIFTLTERGASGNAGNITVSTDDFRLTDDAIVTATTSNDGNAGNININANYFEAVNGGGITTSTSSSGNAGNITLNVKDKITVSGIGEAFRSGLFASTSAESTGQGGNIFIDPRLVIIENGASVSVGSDGTGDAGDIFLEAGTLQLDNGFITAQTASTQGGDINLQLGELLSLRKGSQISTTAGNQQFGGNGGNIDIDTPIIVAIPQENSDITADAFSGDGGNINISTQGIFGIGFQEEPTPESGITASSEFGLDGNVEINTPDTDPTKGLIELPDNIIDNSDQVYIACVPGSPEFENTFISVGTGGIAKSPLEMLQESSIITNWVSLEPRSQTRENRTIKLPP